MASLLSNTSILQSKPEQIRNICILAHVDHGKTTLSDNLIASNGIISQRLAGQLRYLDSREDEQQRGITMQSSAISLLFVDPREKKKMGREALKNGTVPITPTPYLINLIDSPGHVDFSSDVSTAVRLCDGALIVVDAVEGVCIQTQAVLRQAWEERVKPCLVINKVDRLISEVFLTPLEAFHHLRQIIERVNSLVSQMSNADAFAKADEREKELQRVAAMAAAVGATATTAAAAAFSSSTTTTTTTTLEPEKKQEEKKGTTAAAAAAAASSLTMDEDLAASMLFDPTKGNVLFASAIDGWGFSLGPFATLLSKKLGVNRNILLRHLWGDFFYHPTKKSVTRKSNKANELPMIAKYIFEPIWMMYNTVLIDHKPKKAVKMAKSLGVELGTVTEKMLKSPDQLIKHIMRSWLSLSNSVLSCAVRHVPNPKEAQKIRSDRLFPTRSLEKTTAQGMGEAIMERWNQTHESVRNCSADGPLVAFVSKMIAVPKKDMPPGCTYMDKEEDMVGNDGADDGGDNGSSSNMTFVAFARIFSGTLRSGHSLCILGPKYDPFTKKMKKWIMNTSTTTSSKEEKEGEGERERGREGERERERGRGEYYATCS